MIVKVEWFLPGAETPVQTQRWMDGVGDVGAGWIVDVTLRLQRRHGHIVRRDTIREETLLGPVHRTICCAY